MIRKPKRSPAQHSRFRALPLTKLHRCRRIGQGSKKKHAYQYRINKETIMTHDHAIDHNHTARDSSLSSASQRDPQNSEVLIQISITGHDDSFDEAAVATIQRNLLDHLCRAATQKTVSKGRAKN